MKLTSENVSSVFMDCLFAKGEPQENPVMCEGIRSKFGFHPIRLEAHRAEVATMLGQLPKEFLSEEQGGGGGWSFLNAGMDSSGVQWGEHASMEQLFALGIGLGLCRYLMPREMWHAMPGGMPYISVNYLHHIHGRATGATP